MIKKFFKYRLMFFTQITNLYLICSRECVYSERGIGGPVDNWSGDSGICGCHSVWSWGIVECLQVSVVFGRVVIHGHSPDTRIDRSWKLSEIMLFHQPFDDTCSYNYDPRILDY